MSLNPKIWVPKLFFVLETISIYYPLNPNKMTIRKYYDFIQNIPIFFPETPMGSYFISLLEKYPVQPYLTTRSAFMKWVYFIKKKVYKTMKLETFDFYENLENYYNFYKPEEVIDLENLKVKKRYIQFGFFVGVSFLIYYFYNR
tara:strand:- start:335 stop:766 length:432 start_codon:yes stop_codon:yes gene_type:complete